MGLWTTDMDFGRARVTIEGVGKVFAECARTSSMRSSIFIERQETLAMLPQRLSI